MKIFLTAAILLLLIQGVPRTSGDIEGIIFRTDSKEPISDVRISVHVDGPASVQTALTDSGGRFLIKDLPAGDYFLRAVRQGYLPAWGGAQSWDFATSTRVTVKPDQRVAVGTLSLIPGSSVTGRILNPDNSPAAGMTVELLQQGFNAQGVREWRPLEHSRTIADERGQFRMSWFAPGKYYLRTIRRPPDTPGALTTATSVAWTPTTYFPGTLNPALASPIDIAVGQTVNIDLTIPQSNPYTVSGKIANSIPGQTSQPIQLILMRREYGAPIESSSSSLETLNLAAGGDGKFEMRGLPSGSYELFATMRGQGTNARPLARPTWVARTTFDTADQDVDNISVVLRPGFNVTGKLTNGGTVDTQVNISLQSNDGSPVGSLSPRIDGETFLYDNVPEGTYSLSVSVTNERPTAYVADIRSGGRSIFGESLIVGKSGAEPIEIVLNTNGASVPITVVGKADNLPTTVVLVPAAQYRKNLHRYGYTILVNDPSGRVSVNHVAPGEYTIYAWENLLGSSISYMDPEFVSKYGKQGVRINITGQPVANVEVPVVRINPFE